MRSVQALSAETGLSLRKLADELERRGIHSVRGGRWHPKTLRAALAYKIVESAC